MTMKTKPATNASAITKSDSTVLNPPTRALWIGGAGDLVVDFLDGNEDVTLVGVAAGTLLPIEVVKVKDATTATSIVGLY